MCAQSMHDSASSGEGGEQPVARAQLLLQRLEAWLEQHPDSPEAEAELWQQLRQLQWCPVLTESPEPGATHVGMRSQMKPMCGAWLAQLHGSPTLPMLLTVVLLCKTHRRAAHHINKFLPCACRPALVQPAQLPAGSAQVCAACGGGLAGLCQPAPAGRPVQR